MNKTIGKNLQDARIKKSLSIEKISEETFIRKHFLIALEEGDFSQLPSAAQVRGFLRTYAEYLGLDAQKILDSLKQPVSPIEESDEESLRNLGISADPENSKEEMEKIFLEIGNGIKERREILGLSLEDIETHTHIPVNYLRLVESGSFNEFPSPAQARGMLGNYSHFLDMDKYAVMLRFADALQAKLVVEQKPENPDAPKSAPKPRFKFNLPPWLRNAFSADTVVFSVLGLATLIFAIWGISRVLDIQSSAEPKPTAPALSEILLPSPTATNPPSATPSSVELNPTDVIDIPDEENVEPTLQPFQGENIQLYIIAHDRTFLRVSVDGEIEFEGRVVPGTNYPYTANQSIAVLTGDGSALQIFYNGSDLGPLGINGEVVNVIYTRDGIISPTPTLVPTLDPALITPSVTPTTTPTITPTPTPTNIPLT